MALGAARALPDGVRWLSASARVGATRAGQIFAGALLDHYRQTLAELQQVGYVAYARRQLGPYFRAAGAQFSPKRPTLTQKPARQAGEAARPARGSLAVNAGGSDEAPSAS